MIRKIKESERIRAGNIYCGHCKPRKVDAIWRKDGITASHYMRDFACEEHKDLIRKDHENELTEADFQTWMRL